MAAFNTTGRKSGVPGPLFCESSLPAKHPACGSIADGLPAQPQPGFLVQYRRGSCIYSCQGSLVTSLGLIGVFVSIRWPISASLLGVRPTSPISRRPSIGMDGCRCGPGRVFLRMNTSGSSPLWCPISARTRGAFYDCGLTEGVVKHHASLHPSAWMNAAWPPGSGSRR